MRIGEAELRVFKPIVRCAATEVDPVTAARDLQTPRALFDQYGHILCGIYASVTQGGRIAPGVAAELGAA